MPFPTNPTPGQTHTEDNTTWVYAGPVNGWYRRSVSPGNSSDFRSGKGYVGSNLDVNGDITLDDGGTYTTTLQTITPTANRTVSLPDATGTVALVAGSSGQVVWNNAGANAGASTLTYDGSILTTSGRFINSYNATASAPAKVFTGTWFTGGTGTTTKPQVLIEPAGTTSTAWSTSGTGLGVNAATGFTGRLLDLQTNGTSRAIVTGAGNVGIGTASPTYKLEVGGTLGNFGVADNGCELFFTRNANNNINANGGSATLNYGAGAGHVYAVGGTERARIDSGGRLLVGTSTNTGGSLFQVNDNRIRIATAKTPASATDTGSAGEICWDANYIYVCTATNTWKRTAISTW